MKKNYAKILSAFLITLMIFSMASVAFADDYTDAFSEGKKNLLEDITEKDIRGSGQKNDTEGYAALIDYTLNDNDELVTHYCAGPGGTNEDPPGDQYDPEVGNRNWFGFDLGSSKTFDSYQMLGTTLSPYDSNPDLNLCSWILEVSDDDKTWTQVDEVIDSTDEVANRTLDKPATGRYVRFIVVEANMAFTGRIRIGGVKIFESKTAAPVVEAPVIESPAEAPVVEAPVETAPAPSSTTVSPKTGDAAVYLFVILMIAAAGLVINFRLEKRVK